MPRATFLLVVWVLTLLAAPSGRLSAQQSPKSGPPSRRLASLPSAKLIDRLGDASFARREAAAAELLHRGESVREELKEALRRDDLETRLRARDLLQRISLYDFENRLAAFLADKKAERDHDLPSWKRYEKLMGDGRRQRLLFVDMLRDEFDLLKLLDERPKQAVAIFATRVGMLQNGGQQTPASAATLATFFLISMQPEVRLGSPSEMQMYNYLYSRNEPRQQITAGQYAMLLREMLKKMVVRGANGPYSYYHFQLMMRYDLKDASLEMGRKLVSKYRRSNGSNLQYAILILGKYGGEEDQALLEELLENKAQCHSWTRGQGKPILRTQVRDVALAALVHMTGQDHKEYGYRHLLKNEMTIFQIYSMGMDNDQQRDTAIAKWRTWKAKQAK